MYPQKPKSPEDDDSTGAAAGDTVDGATSPTSPTEGGNQNLSRPTSINDPSSSVPIVREAPEDHISTMGSPSQPNISTEGDVDTNRHCWVCFMAEEDEGSDQYGRWVNPCKCRGTSKWVHEECLQRWIDEKQKNNTSAKVSCSQCNTEYLIVFPKMSRFFRWAQAYDNVLTSFAPLASAAIFLGSVYWCAISYGALTVIQVVGHDDGKLWLENADPITLMVGLPSIPTFLILGKLIRWEDALVRFWQGEWISRIPILRSILRSGKEAAADGSVEDPNVASTSAAASPNRSASRRSIRHIPINNRPTYDGARMFCGALLLPTVATFVGKLLYPFVASDFNRALLGGLTFIISKGMLNIYLRQQQRKMAEKRQIIDYDPELEAKQDKSPTSPSSPNEEGQQNPPPADGGAAAGGGGFHLQIHFGNP